jgi:hypothetical protein
MSYFLCPIKGKCFLNEDAIELAKTCKHSRFKKHDTDKTDVEYIKEALKNKDRNALINRFRND